METDVDVLESIKKLQHAIDECLHYKRASKDHDRVAYIAMLKLALLDLAELRGQLEGL